MPSSAFSMHLSPLLADANHVNAARDQLAAGVRGRRLRVAASNRAVVVSCVSAWEAYIEELVRESLNALRPPVPPLGLWPALNATVRVQLGRFNTPSMENIRLLIADALGLADVQTFWTWRNCTSAQAVQRLADTMALRHQIAHGVNPRPAVTTAYANEQPEFFIKLGHRTDSAIRDQLVNVHGIANPWPP